MNVVRTILHIAADGSISGNAPGLSPGDHEAEISADALSADQPPSDPESIMAAIRALQEEFSRLPVLDARSADEILGYDENGLPT